MLSGITLCLLFGLPAFSLDIPPVYAKILDELSWTLKLKLLKDFTDATSTTKAIETTKSARRVGLEAFVMANPEESDNLVHNGKDKSIYINNALAEKDPSEYLRDLLNNKETVQDLFLTKNKDKVSEKYRYNLRQTTDSQRYIRNKKGHFVKSRKNLKYLPRHRLRSGHPLNISSKMGRRQVANAVNVQAAVDTPDDEENMRMKLFRLMYETVRDSDLKVKRAELIKTHYHNSSAFEIGYLMGDITDKYNIMQDITTTLQRLYHEWKPLEHINAYEQIANQAIQISHLIDMMRHINKRNSTI